MIGVIVCSRGLIFAQANDALNRNLEGKDFRIYTSWDLAIPDCQNLLTDKALADKCESLLFVEEDTVLPDHGLDEMIASNSDIACIDYGVAGWGCVTRDRITNEILWCGLGCTLIKRKVFEALEKPYFRSDKALLLNSWPEIKWIDAGLQAYGLQDVYFFTMAREKGFKITQIEGECKHLKLESLGRPEINKGLHQIVQKPIITKKQTL